MAIYGLKILLLTQRIIYDTCCIQFSSLNLFKILINKLNILQTFLVYINCSKLLKIFWKCQ